MLKNLGLTFVVAEAYCKYYDSARFDDVIEVLTWISKLGRSSIRYEHTVRRDDGTKLVEGYVVDVMVNKDRKPHPIPDEIRNRLQRYIIEKEQQQTQQQ